MSFIQLIGMFVLALVVEISGAGYTIAVARGNVKWAIIFSALSAVLGAGILFNVVTDPHLIPASVAGEIAGTFCMLTAAKHGIFKK